MAVNFVEVVKLAEQLNPAQQNVLIYRLRVKQIKERVSSEQSQSAPPRIYAHDWLLRRGSEYVESYRSPTREELGRVCKVVE